MVVILLVFSCALFVAYISEHGKAVLISRRCRDTWIRTKGMVKYFWIHHDTPHVIYEFSVGNTVYRGNAITPEIPAAFSSSTHLRNRKLFLHPDGRPKFYPGQEVEVFHDPANPVVSALNNSFRPSAVSSLALLLIILNSWAIFHMDWIDEHKETLASPTLFLIGFLLSIRHALRFARLMRSRKFSVAKGVVKIAEDRSDKSMHFEYIVGGVLLRSTQIMNLSYWFSNAGGFHGLKHGPEQVVDVFYDPSAPWDGFLQRIHPARVLGPIIVGFVLMLAALARSRGMC